MKILYLSPLIPDVSGNGGKRAIYNHLDDLSRHDVRIKLLVVDVDGGGANCPEILLKYSPIILPRALPRGGDGLWAKIVALMQLFWGRLPRNTAVIASKKAKEEFRRLIASDKFDLVVVDHLTAYGIVENIQFPQPLVYIAHNIESDVLRDRYQIAKLWTLERIISRIEYFKMVHIERKLIGKADKIILISSGDRDSPFFFNISNKVSVWPELPTKREKSWTYSATKSILFVGSSKYFPNKEAICWLVKKLMPEINRLDSSVTLIVAGTSQNEVGLSDVPGVIYAGFVSLEKLEELQIKSDFFICPVVLGSGIKIKVLEASSYGTPIIATKESLRGINYLSGIAPVLTRNAAVDAQTITNYLSNSEKLQGISTKMNAALNHERSIRKSLLEELLS